MSGPAGKRPKRTTADDTLVDMEPQRPVSSIIRSVRLARLEQVRGPGAPRELMLAEADTVIGRSSDADVTIECELLSRKHVVFSKRAGRVRCLDLDSSNGMYLNGIRAHAADLYEDDTIQIGNVVLVFHEGD